MRSKSEILDHAIDVLRAGDALTLDAVARRAALTKPGVVHHFRTKEALVVAVVDHIIDRWEADLAARVPAEATPVERLRAYVDHSLTGVFDNSDLAFMVDVRVRDSLAEQWTARLAPWFGDDVAGTPARRASLRAARLLADGAWFNSALGIDAVRDDEAAAVRRIAQGLIDDGADS